MPVTYYRCRDCRKQCQYHPDRLCGDCRQALLASMPRRNTGGVPSNRHSGHAERLATYQRRAGESLPLFFPPVRYEEEP